MQKEILSTTNAPAAIGPYSQGIAAGDLVFVSGQLPIDPATGVMPEDVKDQARASIKNIKAILEAAGTSLDKVSRRRASSRISRTSPPLTRRMLNSSLLKVPRPVRPSGLQLFPRAPSSKSKPSPSSSHWWSLVYPHRNLSTCLV